MKRLPAYVVLALIGIAVAVLWQNSALSAGSQNKRIAVQRMQAGLEGVVIRLASHGRVVVRTDSVSGHERPANVIVRIPKNACVSWTGYAATVAIPRPGNFVSARGTFVSRRVFVAYKINFAQ